MKEKLPYNVYPEKRKRGYILIEMTGLKRESSSFRIWPKALIAPRKPRYFSTYIEAITFARGKV